MLPQHARDMLKACVRSSTPESSLQSTENTLLAETVAQLKSRYPQHFHNDESLKKRVFFHQPKQSLPCSHFIVPLPPTTTI